LNQLPLPSPLPATTTKSLLFNGRIAEEVNCLLACRDENLVSQLIHSLNQVSTDHMYVFCTSILYHHCLCSLSLKWTKVERDVRIWTLEFGSFLLGLFSRLPLCKTQLFHVALKFLFFFFGFSFWFTTCSIMLVVSSNFMVLSVIDLFMFQLAE